MAKLLEDELLENQDSFWHNHREKIAWFILAFDLIITLVFWNATNDAVFKDAQTRFDFRAEGVQAAIKERMMTYEQVLRSGIGLFEASSQVDRGEWKKFVETLQIEKRFPGIQGIGFALKIAPEEKEEHIRQIQAEGFPDYKIKPEGDREVYTSIIYLEPFDIRNQQAFGYDMFSQIVRREAMEKARDSGETTISGKVTLVQEIDDDVQSGFLVYLPLYKKGMPVNTPEQRRIALKGYVYSPFRAKDLMHGIFGPGSNDIDLEVFDGSDLNKNVLMYDTDEILHLKDNQQDSHLFLTTKGLNLYGHHWTLQFASLPSFEASIQSHKSNFVLALGCIFSLLCFLVIHGAFTTRRQALKYAKGLVLKLNKNEERLSYALEGTNDGLWDWNIVTGEVYFSPRFITMLGYKPMELEGHVKTWENLVHPDDKSKVMHALDEHLKGHTPYYETEHRLKTKDGDWKWILDRGKVLKRDESGKPLRATGTHTDITLRKKAEEELQQHRDHLEELVDGRTKEIQKANLALEKSKSTFANLISNLNGMVYHCKNDKDWTMDFVSDGSIELTGYRPEDFTRGTIKFNEIMHPEDRDRAWDEVQQSLEMKKPYMLNYKIMTSKGDLKYVRAKGRGIWLENGELEGLQGFIFDITDEVTTQNALIKTKEQIAHADKLATLGKLVGSVAHEFNNPLYGVIGLIDNLEDASTPEERKSFTQVAKKECWRMADMIKNLQNFYKPSEGVPSSVDMNKLVEEVLLIIGKGLKQKHIKVTKNYNENIDTFEAVEDQIKQVIINLLQNASDSISEASRKEVVLITDQNENHVILKIQDTGVGIPEENMKTLFDPFFTTKGVKGTGLGLSVSYGIVKKHGGEITVESKVGEGSTFTVSLPLKGKK
jgi:PAS domain S-box-containing protein